MVKTTRKSKDVSFANYLIQRAKRNKSKQTFVTSSLNQNTRNALEQKGYRIEPYQFTDYGGKRRRALLIKKK